MITAQDIHEKTFEKAVFGGYDMASVDAFLEEIANDITLLQKENTVLKGKMKVLVEKVEEYRGNEDALRMAVVSAQRLGNMIEQEAKDNSESLIGNAEAEAKRIKQEAELDLAVEKARLEEAERASGKFIENMRLLCSKQLSYMEKLASTEFAAAALARIAPAEEKPVEEHRETISSMEETVAEPVEPAAAPVEADAEATRPFNVIAPEQTSFDDLGI